MTRVLDAFGNARCHGCVHPMVHLHRWQRNHRVAGLTVEQVTPYRHHRWSWTTGLGQVTGARHDISQLFVAVHLKHGFGDRAINLIVVELLKRLALFHGTGNIGHEQHHQGEPCITVYTDRRWQRREHGNKYCRRTFVDGGVVSAANVAEVERIGTPRMSLARLSASITVMNVPPATKNKVSMPRERSVLVSTSPPFRPGIGPNLCIHVICPKWAEPAPATSAGWKSLLCSHGSYPWSATRWQQRG